MRTEIAIIPLLALVTAACWSMSDAGSADGTDDPDPGDDTGSDSDSSSDTASDTDSGSDADSDSDVDTDTEIQVACGGEPEDCEDIGPTMSTQEYGCCHGDVLHWCIECVEDDENYPSYCIVGQKWHMTFDCAGVGLACGYDDDKGEASCLGFVDDAPHGCGPFPKFCDDYADSLADQQIGCCFAGHHFDCWQAGYLFIYDCVGDGSNCGYNEVSEEVACMGE
jgi:hypothetical protein